MSLLEKMKYINKMKTKSVLENDLETVRIQTSNAKDDLLTYN